MATFRPDLQLRAMSGSMVPQQSGPALMSEAAVTIEGLEVWAMPPGALLVSEDLAVAGARLI